MIPSQKLLRCNAMTFVLLIAMLTLAVVTVSRER